MKDKTMTEQKRMNCTAITCYLVIITIITAAYLMEVVKQNRTLGYFLIVFFALWIPGAMSIFVLIKYPESKWIRYIMSIGFIIPQSYMMFTAQNNLVFTYALLILILVGVFTDLKYAIITSVTYNLVNLSSVIYFFMQKGLAKDLIVTSEIQVLLMILCGIFVILVSRTGTVIANSKLEEINKEKQNVSDLLNRVMSISSDITDGIEKMNGRMTQLGESVEHTCGAMQEVKAGNNETAESIQSQLIMTEEIQNRIAEVSGTAKNIIECIGQTKESINSSSVNMKRLEEQIDVSEKASETTVSKLQELDEYAQQMQSIVELINSVADETGLLSLNASIEAARAGDAGRGFAVVASEISNLASQTQKATSNIDELITNIVNKLDEVSTAINIFVDGNKKQQLVARETVQSLQLIEEHSSLIEGNSGNLNDVVEKLQTANNAIVESIQNISAITEEVAAHSNETYDGSEQDTIIVNEVSQIAEFLRDRATALNNN